ncbi:hypothetical protein SELMODRAFT_425390 [Selaginella moellendorffii]|uniref:Uncharacterized protein n=1 Tax=Selaginella moellendorffii TaxID=88036 RepID=D8SSY4_SELML|nr:hypothetical protein SELMODRAFT_425390 [Selaginella moellendorffii]
MEEDDESSDSSFSTVSSSAPLTRNASGIGCSSIFTRIRGGRGRQHRQHHRARGGGDRAGAVRIGSSPYKLQERILSRQKGDARNRSGLGQLLSPDRLNVSVARNIFPGDNVVDVQKEQASSFRRDRMSQKLCEASGTKIEQPHKSGTLSSAIAEIFRCFICLGKLMDAQLCPCCSKLVCMLCIKRWLTDQKPECPHCRASLSVSQLVGCKFISEITTEVEKIHGNFDEDAPPEKICPAHGSPLSYFCTTCSTAVCSDCAILAESHQNHSFERLNVTYGRHSKKLHVEASALRSRLKDLYDMLASVDNDIEAVLKAKDDQATEIEAAFKRMRAKLEEQLKCKLLTLLAQKGAVSQEVELLETILRQLDFQLTTSSKSDLIAHEPTITCIIQDLHKKINLELRRDPVSSDFVSEVIPPFEHGELVLKNFRKYLHAKPSKSNDSSSTTDSTSDIVYSAPISAAGITWRLKLYPNGSGSSKGSHISAFLEEGACWGYYQFFKIDDLENEGYLLPGEDTLTLSFYVRAQTFLQQCLDLRRALSSCQAERQEAVTQVAVLRRAFASSIWQQRRRKNGSVSELEDNQGSIKQVLAGAVSSLLPTFEQPNPKAARDTFSRLDKILLSGVPTSDAPQKSEVDDRSDAPSMALSQASVQPESREKCELWLKSRDNLFQMPASRSKFYGRRGHRHRKSNRAFDVVSLAKRTRMATLPCAILEGNDESVNT